jgi:hypothetical protein
MTTTVTPWFHARVLFADPLHGVGRSASAPILPVNRGSGEPEMTGIDTTLRRVQASDLAARSYMRSMSMRRLRPLDWPRLRSVTAIGSTG